MLDATPDDHRETLQLLDSSTFVQQAREEKAARTLAERKQAASSRQKIDADRLKAYTAKESEMAAGFQSVKDAEAALTAAKLAYRDTFVKHQQIGQALDLEFDEATRLLLETCSPAIKLFVSEMHDLIAAARGQISVQETVARNPVTGKSAHTVYSNAPSINARVKAINEAIDAALAMRLEADQSKVPERLQKLRNDLPAVRV